MGSAILQTRLQTPTGESYYLYSITDTTDPQAPMPGLTEQEEDHDALKSDAIKLKDSNTLMSDLSEKGAPLMMFNRTIDHQKSENTRLMNHESKDHTSAGNTEHENNNSKNNNPSHSISELKEIIR
jgi:hypothetical protein